MAEGYRIQGLGGLEGSLVFVVEGGLGLEVFRISFGFVGLWQIRE